MREMFSLPFMQAALAAGLLIGLISSYFGVYVVLRRIVFVGAALAQISALGVASAVFLGKDPSLFAFLFTMAGVLILFNRSGKCRLSQEAIIGICFVSSWAFAILILSKAAHGEADMLNMLQGNILGVTRLDILRLAWVFVPVALAHFIFRKQILFSSFDPEMASTLQVKSGFWNLLFFLTLGLAVSASIKVAGVLLTFSFLLLPASTALMAGNNLKTVFVLSAGFAVAATFLGLMSSFHFDLPSGPAIAGTSLLLLLSVLAASRLIEFIRERAGSAAGNIDVERAQAVESSKD
jgi:ABC-type Mn2+/Zn2+ transport system permease subunit